MKYSSPRLRDSDRPNAGYAERGIFAAQDQGPFIGNFVLPSLPATSHQDEDPGPDWKDYYSPMQSSRVLRQIEQLRGRIIALSKLGYSSSATEDNY